MIFSGGFCRPIFLFHGFTDDYHGDRYQAVPDSMYTDPVSGYIEK